jgi:hypothetical protein
MVLRVRHRSHVGPRDTVRVGLPHHAVCAKRVGGLLWHSPGSDDQGDSHTDEAGEARPK